MSDITTNANTTTNRLQQGLTLAQGLLGFTLALITLSGMLLAGWLKIHDTDSRQDFVDEQRERQITELRVNQKEDRDLLRKMQVEIVDRLARIEVKIGTGPK